jgi:hypothetical protein
LAQKVGHQGYIFYPAIFDNTGEIKVDNVAGLECFGIDIDAKGDLAHLTIEGTVEKLKELGLDFAFAYGTFSFQEAQKQINSK